MIKLKVRRLKWKNLKVRRSVLHFCPKKKSVEPPSQPIRNPNHRCLLNTTRKPHKKILPAPTTIDNLTQTSQSLQYPNPTATDPSCNHEDREVLSPLTLVHQFLVFLAPENHFHRFSLAAVTTAVHTRKPQLQRLTTSSFDPYHHLCSALPWFQFCPLSRCRNLISLHQSDLMR